MKSRWDRKAVTFLGLSFSATPKEVRELALQFHESPEGIAFCESSFQCKLAAAQFLTQPEARALASKMALDEQRAMRVVARLVDELEARQAERDAAEDAAAEKESKP